MSSFPFNDISLDDLKQGLADGSLILVDVREAEEFAAGHIKGALFNPLSKFDPAKLPVAPEGKKVIIYCRSGRRSVTAMRLSSRQRTARESTMRSRSRPRATRSSTWSRCDMRATSCSMMGPSSSTSVT